ncbi:MAG: acyl carrier protein [Verrucomicrobiota bacterium]
MSLNDLRQIVAGVLEVEPEQLTPETDLRQFDTFDSVNVLNLMMTLNIEANIQMSPADAQNLRQFGDLIRLAEKQGIALQ